MANRILVVDDEEVVLASVRKALRKDDYEIDTVQRVADGLALLEEHTYDVVLTDLMMPEIDGLGMLERIRERQLNVQTIMITGYPTVKTALKAKRLGAFEYVTKPFTRQELRSVVVRALRHAAGRASSPHDPSPPSPSHQADGVLFFIPDHVWVRREQGSVVTVGMARAFAESVGEVAVVVLPEEHAIVEQGRACMIVRAADGIEHSLHSPISGRVIEVNADLADHPERAHADPEATGWLLRVEAQDLARELQNLVPG